MKVACFLIVIPLLIFATTPLLAAKMAKGERFTLSEQETLATDLYFGGQAIDIAGRLNGSLLAGCKEANISGTVLRNLFLACEKLTLTGTIGGDILTCGSEININGVVNGALRAAAKTVRVKGTIGGDILAGCKDLIVDSLAQVKGDVIAGCQNLKIYGTVNGNLRAAAQKVVIAGKVLGDVNLTLAEDGGELLITDDALILGNLNYKTYKEINIGNTTAVKGKINPTICTLPRAQKRILSALSFGFFIYSLLCALIITFILVAICRTPLEKAIATCQDHFGATIGFGAIGLFAPPLALLIAALFIITIPAVIIAKIGYLVIFYLAKTLTGIFFGRTLFRLFGAPGVSLWLAAPIGVIIIYCLCSIPVIGWLFWLFALLLGFGVFIRLLNISKESAKQNLTH